MAISTTEPSKDNPFLRIRSRAGDVDRSLEWYQTQVKALARSKIMPNNLMRNTDNLTTHIIPGGLYLFYYDAKFKDVLPYWDQFPLVLPFRRVKAGFYGINLHYLPYPLRFKLLGLLHDLASDKDSSEDTRIRVSWRIILTMARIAPVEACVKHYLVNHVQSRFLEIKYPDWVTASLLPVEQFVGASKQSVWRKSRGLI